MSVGRTEHSPIFRVVARASVVFFDGTLEAPAAIFVSLLMTPDTIAERRYANQFCRRDDWMIE